MIKEVASNATRESTDEIVKSSGFPAMYEKIVKAIAGGWVWVVNVTKAETITTLITIPARLPLRKSEGYPKIV
ncbi:MAG: hypothetical protein ACYDAZ_04360 [Thermoplasmataceae archaeon]